jgi:glycosyltransferase involved in cell wall biosynthesis
MPNPLRIVEIIYSFDLAGTGGGAARFCLELSRRLDPCRFEAAVCGIWSHGTASEQEQIRQLQTAGIEAFTGAIWDGSRPYASFWRAFRGIRSMLLPKAVDIVHSHSEFGDIVALLLRGFSRQSAIVRSVHNGYRREWRKSPLRRLILTNLLYPAAFDVEIGINQSIVKTLDERWAAGLLGRQAVHIGNAIDLSRFDSTKADRVETRRALGVPPGGYAVGTVGRLAPGKGCDTLLQAAAVVLRDLPQAYFFLVGDGELIDSLKQSSRRLGIEDHVIFTGPRSDIEQLLSSLDLLVSPSLWEGLSTVILESMASGTPVIATDIPGNHGIIEDGVSGHLLPPGDPVALAAAIVDALGKPSRRQQYACHALSAVKAFSIDAVVAEHESLYSAIRSPQKPMPAHGPGSTLRSPTSKI